MFVMVNYKKLQAVFGEPPEMAEKLGLKSDTVVYNWIRRGSIPKAHFLRILQASKGQITLEDLLPAEANNAR